MVWVWFGDDQFCPEITDNVGQLSMVILNSHTIYSFYQPPSTLIDHNYEQPD